MSKLFLTQPTYSHFKDTKVHTQRKAKAKANDIPTDWSKYINTCLATAGLVLTLLYVLAALWILIEILHKEFVDFSHPTRRLRRC